MKPIHEEFKISFTKILKTPLWIIKNAQKEISEHTKTKNHPGTYWDKLRNILKRNPNHLYTFTIFTNPSARLGYDTKSIFKRRLTGLNSEFSFS